MELNNKGRRPVRSIARTQSVLESLDLAPVGELVEVADVVEDTIDAVEVGLDILSDILDGNEFLPSIIEDEDHTLEDHIEDEEDFIEDVDQVEVVMESIRNKRIRARKSNESVAKDGRMRVRANEALDLKETCPACGSKTFNERSKSCSVCKLGVKAVLAAESAKPKLRKRSRANESEEYTEDEELALIELEDGAVIDANDDFAVIVDGDVDVELTDATHTLLLDVEDDNGEDDVEELTLSTGVVDTEAGDVAVVLFDDELVSDVVDILLGENSDQVEVVDTDLGTDLIVQVVSEEVLESGEVEVFEEEPLVIHVEETADGAVVHTNEFDDVEDLLDFVEDLVGEAGEVVEADEESDALDEEEVFEEPTFDDVEDEEVVLESTTKRQVRGRR